MPSKILLVNVNRCVSPDPVFPLGMAYVSAALRRAGHRTRWWDLQVDGPGLEEVLQQERPDFAGISLRNIDDILIGTRETFFDHVAAISELIHTKAHCPVILGGSGFSIFPRPLLERTGADYGICGEGEASMVALVDALEKGADPRTVPGLVYRTGEGTIAVNPKAPSAPTWGLGTEGWPAEVVRHYLAKSRMLNVQTQRGCALHCAYCTYPVLEGKHPRSRDPEMVADEFASLNRIGAPFVFIVDSVFNSSPAHVQAICEAILRRNVRMRWGCFLRPQGVSAELMALMARAGLSNIEFGTDSFCDEVLPHYGKSFTFEDVLLTSQLAHRHKIDHCHFLICGGPGETERTLAESFANSRQLPDAPIMAVVGMRIYPGTALEHRAQAEGRIQPETDLLVPTYYLAEGLTEQTVFSQLHRFAVESPNWIPGAPSPGLTELGRRLRQKGVTGPLWSHFPALQRLAPNPGSA